MHIHGAWFYVDIPPPNCAQYIFATEDPFWVAKKKLKQAELGRAKIQQPTIAHNPMRGWIEFEIMKHELGLCLRNARTTQKSANASD